MNNGTAIVRLEKVYADGSGAPATVLVEGYYFAVDYIAGARLNSLTNRKAPKRVLSIARRAYERELRRRADAAWFEQNAAMYAP